MTATLPDLNITSSKALPSPASLLERYPLSRAQQLLVHSARQSVRDILEGKDSRLALIVGPCSVHNITAAEEYATKLRQLADEVSDQFLLLMRVHFEKPRSTVGWKGLLYDPHLDSSHDIEEGLQQARRFLGRILDIGLPTATEFLDPASPLYLADMICWGQIGARTSASQIHRQMGSSLPMPVGFKNSTDGDIGIAINAAIAASHPHTYLSSTATGNLARICSSGNPHAHIILRGGNAGVNYHSENVKDTVERLEEHQVCRRVLIDCSHDNCRRDHTQQIVVFHQIIQQVLDGEANIFGAIIESFLESGRQHHDMKSEKILPSVSLTDPCLDWDTTARIITDACQRLRSRPKVATAAAFPPLEAEACSQH